MSYDSTGDTLTHIQQVRYQMKQVIEDLVRRATSHDASKLKSPEKEVFDKYTPMLADSTYGSHEYKQFLREMQSGLKHHYSENDHHPEHFRGGVKEMNLVQVLEMLCDWKAATMRHNDGNLRDSIMVNADRFKYSDEFRDMLIRTAQYFEWL